MRVVIFIIIIILLTSCDVGGGIYYSDQVSKTYVDDDEMYIYNGCTVTNKYVLSSGNEMNHYMVLNKETKIVVSVPMWVKYVVDDIINEQK